MVTKRLLPGQFDILTILVVTAAVAVTCALLRSPLRLDIKILAVSVALSFFLVWALWYHEGLRTHFPTILAPVPWAMFLGLWVYLYSLPTSGRGGSTVSILALGTIAFSAVMLLWKIYIIHKTIYGRVHDAIHVESSSRPTPSTARMNLGRVALISALTMLLLFTTRVLIKYIVWGHYEFSSFDLQLVMLLLVVMVLPLVVAVVQKRAQIGK